MCRIVVSREDLRHNIACIRRRVQTPIIGVLKMNGYGITMRYAAEAWLESGVRFFAVATASEAFALLNLGYREIEILILSPVYERTALEQLIQNNVILTITSAECASAAIRAGKAVGQIPRAHLKIDTGMGRFGMRCDQTDAICGIYRREGIQIEGVYSHFAKSFEKRYKKTRNQMERFQAVLSALQSEGIEPGMCHIAESCAALRFPETRLDAVRIGSALVGRLPCAIELPLRRVGVFETAVLDIKTLHKGETSGYAMLFKTRRETRAAVVQLGYRYGFGLRRPRAFLHLWDLPLYLLHGLKMALHPPTADFCGVPLSVVGRIGGQFTLLEATDLPLEIGGIVRAEIDLLLTDSMIERMRVD